MSLLVASRERQWSPRVRNKGTERSKAQTCPAANTVLTRWGWARGKPATELLLVQGAGAAALSTAKGAKGSDGRRERALAEFSRSSLESHRATGSESPAPHGAAGATGRGDTPASPRSQINPLRASAALGLNHLLELPSCAPATNLMNSSTENRATAAAWGAKGNDLYQETTFPGTMRVLRFSLQMAISISSKSISCY